MHTWDIDAIERRIARLEKLHDAALRKVDGICGHCGHVFTHLEPERKVGMLCSHCGHRKWKYVIEREAYRCKACGGECEFEDMCGLGGIAD